MLVVAAVAAGCSERNDEPSTTMDSELQYKDAAFTCFLAATQQDISTHEFKLPRVLSTSVSSRYSWSLDEPWAATSTDGHIFESAFRIYNSSGWTGKGGPASLGFGLADVLVVPNKELFEPPAAPVTYRSFVVEADEPMPWMVEPRDPYAYLLMGGTVNEEVVDATSVVRIITNPRHDTWTIGVTLDQMQTTNLLNYLGAKGFTSKNIPALSIEMIHAGGYDCSAPVQLHLPPEDNNGISFHVSLCCGFY